MIRRSPLFAVLAFVALAIAPPLAAKHNGATMKLDRGNFSVTGNVAKNACSAQANLKSKAGMLVGFAIYWRPDESIHMLVSHPSVAQLDAKPKIAFHFPDGTDLAFRMTRTGTKLQMPLGLANNIPALFHAVKTNPQVVITVIGVDDVIDLDLAARGAVMDAMEACRQWLI